MEVKNTQKYDFTLVYEIIEKLHKYKNNLIQRKNITQEEEKNKNFLIPFLEKNNLEKILKDYYIDYKKESHIIDFFSFLDYIFKKQEILNTKKTVKQKVNKHISQNTGNILQEKINYNTKNNLNFYCFKVEENDNNTVKIYFKVRDDKQKEHGSFIIYSETLKQEKDFIDGEERVYFNNTIKIQEGNTRKVLGKIYTIALGKNIGYFSIKDNFIFHKEDLEVFIRYILNNIEK